MAHDAAKGTSHLSVDNPAWPRLVHVLLFGVVVQRSLRRFCHINGVFEGRHLGRIALRVWPHQRRAQVLEDVRIATGGGGRAGGCLFGKRLRSRRSEGNTLRFASLVLIFTGDLVHELDSVQLRRYINGNAESGFDLPCQCERPTILQVWQPQ